jgi:ppGpp synthetase/RelA/SpoT-type nucleotidyltranferase
MRFWKPRTGSSGSAQPRDNSAAADQPQVKYVPQSAAAGLDRVAKEERAAPADLNGSETTNRGEAPSTDRPAPGTNGRQKPDADLALRCHQINESARAVQCCFRHELEKLANELTVYKFYDRLKGQKHIQNKVLRMRDEAAALARRGSPSKSWRAEDVTDAWGCRFVTLFQSEMLDVMSGIFRLIEGWNRSDQGKYLVRIEVINVYTNRPDNDPLSIAGKSVELVQDWDASPFLWRDGAAKLRDKIRYSVDSRDTGYSSVHFVLQAHLQGELRGESAADAVKFEIQIRDIFEEAWGQISHKLSYREKDQFDENGMRAPDTVDMIARSQLNALKSVTDGCGQQAEQIRRIYADMRGRFSVVGFGTGYRSITPLKKICDWIVNKIPAEQADLSGLVTTAYALVQDARDAADKSFDNRVARSNYLAAAGRFQEAVARAGHLLTIELHHDKTIEWYLKIEWANALILSLPARLKDADDSEERNYRRALELYRELEAKPAGDPVMLLRRAQAERKAIRSEDEAIATIRRLERCLKRLDEGAERRKDEADLTKQLARIELGLARLAYTDYLSTRDPRAAEAQLRLAITEVQAIAVDVLPGRSDAESLRVYHRALSNVLWLCHRLRAVEGAELQKQDIDIIASNIRTLRNDVFWPTVQFYAETIENLMYGYDIVGDKESRRSAKEMAELNLKLLRELADDRRWLGDTRTTTDILNAEEKEIYVRALDFLLQQELPRNNRA